MTATLQRPLADPFDIRCSAHTPRRVAGEGRCQLQVGHDGDHAAMYSGVGRRHVITWSAGSAPEPCADFTRKPWMRGFPTPAWIDAGETVLSLPGA